MLYNFVTLKQWGGKAHKTKGSKLMQSSGEEGEREREREREEKDRERARERKRESERAKEGEGGMEREGGSTQTQKMNAGGAVWNEVIDKILPDDQS